MNTKSILFLVVLLGLSGTSFPQGSLTPPPGLPAPTMKTLDQLDAKLDPRTALNGTNTPGDADSVYRIASSGSYYLTNDLVVTAGKSGIEIAASNVTIDLCGFSINSSSTLAAIRLTVSGRTNISIRNGHLTGASGGGIDIVPSSGGTATIGGTVENINVTGSSGTGIHVGDSVTLSRCTANNNSFNGFRTGNACTISQCSASSNGNSGFLTSLSSTVTHCAAHGNTLSGIVGNTISHCSANENGLGGISGGNVSYCSASNNGGDGIGGSAIIHCSASSNTGNGIRVGTFDTVIECLVTSNRLHGIKGDELCVIRGNICGDNGLGGTGAGISTDGNGNRIEGNQCTNADTGINVLGSGNVIVRNTCANNTLNWSIAANNVFGPIIDRSAVISFPVSGDAAGSSLGSTDANANYTY